MKKKAKLALFLFFAIAVVLATLLYIQSLDAALLAPQGSIGERQKTLLLVSTALMLIVVIPVFVMTVVISWKYRASNKQAKYSPNWDQSWLAEAIWCGVPFLIIIALSILTWKSSYSLDPFKPIEGKHKPMSVQVVALEWKWLFLYPEQKVASLNCLQIPEQTPIAFQITSDAPMNSFWIPQLGGQIYAMPGMRSELHLIADRTGVYRGCSAHLSGEGFAAMHFDVVSSSRSDFDAWIEGAQSSPLLLNWESYEKLALPSEEQTAVYTLDEDIYDAIIKKYKKK